MADARVMLYIYAACFFSGVFVVIWMVKHWLDECGAVDDEEVLKKIRKRKARFRTQEEPDSGKSS